MGNDVKTPCCEHGLIWHHENRGCGYLGYNDQQRCPCALTFDEAVTAHDQAMRESIAAEIDALRPTTLTNAQDDLLDEAARIVRGVTQ